MDESFSPQIRRLAEALRQLEPFGDPEEPGEDYPAEKDVIDEAIRRIEHWRDMLWEREG